MQGLSGFLGRFAGVSAVSFLTYLGEYTSFIIVLAFASDKLTGIFHLGTFGYGLIGTISGAYLVTSGLIAVPIGHLCDKYGRKRFTVLGSSLGAAALLSLILVDHLPGLLEFAVAMTVILTFLGIGHGTYTASTLAYTGDVASDGDLGKPYGLVELAEFAAFAFGPTVGGVIAVLWGRTPTFAISGIMLLVAAGIAAAFMPERNPADGQPVSHSASWRDFFSTLKSSVIGATVLTTFFSSLAFTAFFFYVPLYAYSLRFSIPQFAYLYPAFASIMAGTGVVAMVPLGHIEDRTKRRMPVLVTGLLLGSVALLAVFFSANLVTLVFASVSFGVSLAMTRVSQLVLLAERTDFESRAAIMGTNHALEHAGYGVGAVVGGSLVALFGLGDTFRYLSAVLLLAALLFLIYARLRNVQ